MKQVFSLFYRNKGLSFGVYVLWWHCFFHVRLQNAGLEVLRSWGLSRRRLQRNVSDYVLPRRGLVFWVVREDVKRQDSSKKLPTEHISVLFSILLRPWKRTAVLEEKPDSRNASLWCTVAFNQCITLRMENRSRYLGTVGFQMSREISFPWFQCCCLAAQAFPCRKKKKKKIQNNKTCEFKGDSYIDLLGSWVKICGNFKHLKTPI